jgi:hypothetical protein
MAEDETAAGEAHRRHRLPHPGSGAHPHASFIHAGELADTPARMVRILDVLDPSLCVHIFDDTRINGHVKLYRAICCSLQGTFVKTPGAPNRR